MWELAQYLGAADLAETESIAYLSKGKVDYNIKYLKNICVHVVSTAHSEWMSTCWIRVDVLKNLGNFGIPLVMLQLSIV